MLKTVARIAQIAFLAAATGIMVWFLWGKIGSGAERRELQAFRRTLAQEAVADLVYEMPRRDEIKKLVVLPVSGDLDRRVYDMLYDALEDAELYYLVPQSDVLEHIEEQRRGREPLSHVEAVTVGRAFQAEDAAVQGVLYTKLTEFTDGHRGEGAEVALEAALIELERGAPVPGGIVRSSAVIDSKWSLDYFTPWMEERSAPARIAIYLLFTVALPFLLLPVVKGVLAERNTSSNLALVGGLTLADVLCALVLMGLSPGWFGMLVLVLALCAAGLYNIAILEKIEEAA